MLALLDFANDWVRKGGLLALAAIVFAESGLLIGFFLPGDSLLFTAGLLCATAASSAAHLSLVTVLPAAVGGAVLGAQTGFWIGARLGPRFLDRPDRPRLRHAIERAQQALERYGTGKALVLARFIPVVRTVVNPLAGTIGLPTRTFTFWQVLGGTVWAVGVTMAGYLFGSSIPDVDHWLLPIAVLIVVASLVPVAIEARRGRRSRPRPSRRTEGTRP